MCGCICFACVHACVCVCMPVSMPACWRDVCLRAAYLCRGGHVERDVSEGHGATLHREAVAAAPVGAAQRGPAVDGQHQEHQHRQDPRHRSRDTDDLSEGGMDGE